MLAIGIGCCLLYLLVELYLLSGRLGFPLDDSWIHMVFARNLAAGEGLSFNPGELVPGSTAPLWTALLSVLFWMPGNPVVWTQMLGAALYLSGGLLTHSLAVELGLDRGLAWMAASLTLATSWLVWSALSGLEIPLFVVLSLAGILFHIRERRDPSRVPVSIPLLATSFLARPEGILLLLLALVDRCLVLRAVAEGSWVLDRPRWRGVTLGLMTFAVVALPVLLFNLSATGSPLPTTFGAKSQGLSHWLPEIGYLFTVFGILFQAQPWMTLLAPAGALVSIANLGGRNDAGLLPTLWLFGLPLAYGLIDPPGQVNLVGNFGRYFFPLFPIVVVLGMLAVAPLVRQFKGGVRLGRWRVPVHVVALLVIVLPTAAELLQGASRYGQSVLNVEESDVAAARWLARRLPPEAVLGVGDIGALKYFLPNRVVDLAGIASPEIKVWGVEAFMEHHRPDYLVIFPNWLEKLFEDVSRFPVVHQIPIADNITMAGDVLAVYATPWTRYPLTEPKEGRE